MYSDVRNAVRKDHFNHQAFEFSKELCKETAAKKK